MAQKGVKARAGELKEKVEKKRDPHASEEAERVSKALNVLVGLLDSGDEKIRLEAAKAILGHHPHAQSEEAAEGAVKKVVKRVTKLA